MILCHYAREDIAHLSNHCQELLNPYFLLHGHCTDDFVKLGAIYLNKGFYKNKQLISENWINLSLEKSLGFDQSDKKDFCIKGGMYGQKLFISFKQNRAVAVGAFDEGDDYFVEFMKNFD